MRQLLGIQLAGVILLCSGCLLGVTLPEILVPVVVVPSDVDEDGYSTAEGDCDDFDVERFPGNDEVVGDGIDQDCDNMDVCHADADGDNWGAENDLVTVPLGQGCVDGEGAAANNLDCDDSRDRKSVV